MKISRKENILSGVVLNNMKIEQYVFDREDNFIYFRTVIYSKNNMQQEIQQRIMYVYRARYSLVSLFKLELHFKESKVRLYIA